MCPNNMGQIELLGEDKDSKRGLAKEMSTYNSIRSIIHFIE